MPQRLERSATNRVVAGVCGGLAEYLQIDATLVRAFFVISAVLTAGLLILVYIVLLVLMPLPGQRAPIDDMFGTSTPPPPAPSGGSGEGPTEDAGVATTPIARRREGAAPRDGAGTYRRRQTFAYIVIAIGVIFLLSNVGAFRLIQWSYVWPVVLIGVGALLLIGRGRQ